jgi:hypothetical protein
MVYFSNIDARQHDFLIKLIGISVDIGVKWPGFFY